MMRLKRKDCFAVACGTYIYMGSMDLWILFKRLFPEMLTSVSGFLTHRIERVLKQVLTFLNKSFLIASIVKLGVFLLNQGPFSSYISTEWHLSFLNRKVPFPQCLVWAEWIQTL